MSISDLQEELIGIITMVPAMNEDKDKDELDEMKKRALEIICDLKCYLNDNIKFLGKEMTILAYIALYDSTADGVRLNNKSLFELEELIKNKGGRLSNIQSINAAKRSLYAILPISILSVYSTAVFVIQFIENSDARIAVCLSVLGLWLCIKLANSIRNHEMVWREEYNNIEKHKNLLQTTLGFVTINCIAMGLLVLASLTGFMIQYIIGNNTQAASSFFILGSLIFISAGVAALQIHMAIQVIKISSEADHTRGEGANIGQLVSSEADHTRGEGANIGQLVSSEADHTREGASIEQPDVESFAQPVRQVFLN